MIKKIFTLVGLAFSLLSFSACDKKDVRDEDTLIIGTSADNPPFEFYQNGEIVGFDIDLGHLIGERLNKKVTFVDMPFDSLIAALQSKKVDMVLAAMTPSEDRKRAVDFTRTYHKAGSVIVVGDGEGTTLADLQDKTIGVQMGSTHEVYAKEKLSKHVAVSLRSLGKVTELIQEIKTKRIAGFITGKGEGTKIISLNPTFSLISLPDSGGGEAVVLPKNSPLTEKVDGILDALDKRGDVMTPLLEKWKIDG
jgi:ABC-type amino acid transport substrate-binding protein